MNKDCMSADELNKFVAYCKKIQPQSQQDIKRFFEGVVGFPYDKELLLQAYLFLNIQSLFPSCSELLLFEKSPIADYTDLGKCDFVYLIQVIYFSSKLSLLIQKQLAPPNENVVISTEIKSLTK